MSSNTLELNAEVKKAIGSRITTERVLAQPVCEELALRWEDIVVREGLPTKEKEVIFKKYNPSNNCLFIDPLALNLDFKASLHQTVCKRDDRIVDKQKKITVGLSAVSLAMNEVFAQKDINLQMVAVLSDVGSIFADLQHDEINIRKNLILSNHNPTFKETLKDSTPDQLLFGKDLEERLKLRELIEKSSKRLRATPKVANFLNNLKNSKNPSRSKKFKAVQLDGNITPASHSTHSKKNQYSQQKSSQRKSSRQHSRYPSRRDR